MSESQEDNAGVSRRKFLQASSIAAFTAGIAANPFGSKAATAQSNLDDLSEHVHPHARARRDDVPVEKNAFWDWRKAVKAVESLDVFASNYAREQMLGKEKSSAFTNAISEVQVVSTGFPIGDAGKAVRQWLDASGPAFALIAEGQKKERYQIPKGYLLTSFESSNWFDDMSIPREVTRRKWIRAKKGMADGDIDGASTDVFDLVRIANMAVGSDGFLIHYLIAAAAYGFAMEAVAQFARFPAASPASLKALTNAVLASRPTADAVAQTFRCECTYYMPKSIARYPAGNDLPAIVDVLMSEYFEIRDEADSILGSPEQVQRVRAGILRMFAGHPAPLDRAETVRLYSGVVAAMIEDLSTPWLERKQDHEQPWLKQLEPWPLSLQFVTLFSDASADDASAPASITDADIDNARKDLLQVHNPIGKLLLNHLASFHAVRTTYHHAVLRWDAALVVLAVRRFLDDNRQLPSQLADLVDAGFLASIPIDPFSGNPIQYSRERALIWSVDIEQRNGTIQEWRLPTLTPGSD